VGDGSPHRSPRATRGGSRRQRRIGAPTPQQFGHLRTVRDRHRSRGIPVPLGRDQSLRSGTQSRTASPTGGRGCQPAIPPRPTIGCSVPSLSRISAGRTSASVSTSAKRPRVSWPRCPRSRSKIGHHSVRLRRRSERARIEDHPTTGDSLKTGGCGGRRPMVGLPKLSLGRSPVHVKTTDRPR
jgi:hypothetical protein